MYRIPIHLLRQANSRSSARNARGSSRQGHKILSSRRADSVVTADPAEPSSLANYAVLDGRKLVVFSMRPASDCDR